MTYLQNWDKYNVVVIIYRLIIHTTHTCADANGTHTNIGHAHAYV